MTPRVSHRRAGDGPAILWVHGYTLDGSIWAPIWDQLPGFEHLAVDLPGHGLAVGDAGGKGLFAAGIDAVVEVAGREGVRRAVAMSYGGAVAIHAMVRAPGLFDPVVLAAPGLPGGPTDPGAASLNLELAAMARERGLGPWLAERWLRKPSGIFDGLRRRGEAFEAVAAVVRAHAWSELLDSGFAELSELALDAPSLASLRARLTILIGEDDMPAFKRIAEILRRSVPGARRHWLAGIGHQPLLEAPETCAPLLRGALA